MDHQNPPPHDEVQAPEDELSEQELEQVIGGVNSDVMPFGPSPSLGGGVPMPLPTSNEPSVRPPPTEP